MDFFLCHCHVAADALAPIVARSLAEMALDIWAKRIFVELEKGFQLSTLSQSRQMTENTNLSIFTYQNTAYEELMDFFY